MAGCTYLFRLAVLDGMDWILWGGPKDWARNSNVASQCSGNGWFSIAGTSSIFNIYLVFL